MRRVGAKRVLTALTQADEFAANVQSALPIIAVDLAPDLLSSMTLESNWITDDEAWRTLTHSVLPNSERNYGAEVRRAVAEHAKSPGGCVWLFSVREARVSGALLGSQLTTRASSCSSRLPPTTDRITYPGLPDSLFTQQYHTMACMHMCYPCPSPR